MIIVVCTRTTRFDVNDLPSLCLSRLPSRCIDTQVVFSLRDPALVFSFCLLSISLHCCVCWCSSFLSFPFYLHKMIVTITGAAGQVAYSLLAMIAAGELYGPETHVVLRLLDLEMALQVLEGVREELQDSVYPLLDGVEITSDARAAFAGADMVLMCGAFPRRQGMERQDLLQVNKAIFMEQGAVLGEVAAPGCRVVVVGNPANTNALVLLHAAKGRIDPRHVTALTRLDHNRAAGLLAARAGVHVRAVRNCIVWGNHNTTQVPDVTNATIDGRAAREAIADEAFLDTTFPQQVRLRGQDIIRLRGKSAALSTGKAIIDHARDWLAGTPEGVMVSMAVYSAGNPYGIPEDLIFSFPCTCKDGEWTIVPGLDVSTIQEGLRATADERGGGEEAGGEPLARAREARRYQVARLRRDKQLRAIIT
ncbi:cytosolic malate dehydrogenase [Strigomonas culicis]|uniref:malate dehydrogenase n=1 Tax=Strigomonas culicis TaxID=28005 RepID=S9VFT7_9TRYP|nr:cytosolic malate dehydrogenase [Strigomonas culicis]|eukprot:EPY22015.1 cytosolic malate dehydrogenase [Strigomonas culicis]